MAQTQTRWSNATFERLFGAAYDFGVEHKWVAAPVARALMDARVDRFYRALDVVQTVPDGGSVLDVPCGGGVALRGLRPGQWVRYVAADISPTMLDRARRRARERGADDVEFVEADIERLPFADGEFDLCVCFNGLHCLPRPAAAVTEVARCLKPGGRLSGDCILRGEFRRTDLWIRAMQAGGVFGEPGTRADVAGWLTAAGLRVAAFEQSGAIGYFTASRPE